MNTVTSAKRWLSLTVMSVLNYLNVLMITGTEEELKSLHAAVDAAFTVVKPIQYAVRFFDGMRNYIMCSNEYSQGLDGFQEDTAFFKRIQRFNTVAEVKAELRKRAVPTSWKFSDLCIVEIQGDKVLRVVEPATLGEPKKFAVAWIYNGGGRFFSAMGHYYTNRIGHGNSGVENALAFTTVAAARAHAMETTEGGTGSTFADVRLCIFDITDAKNIIEVEEVIRVKPLEYVVRYKYTEIYTRVRFLGSAVGCGTTNITTAKRFKTPTEAMKNITFSVGINKDEVASIEIVEVRGDEIVRVVA